MWNTHLKKRLLCLGLDPQTHAPLSGSAGCYVPSLAPPSPTTRHMTQWESARLEAEARLSRESLLFNPQPKLEGKTTAAEGDQSDYFLRLWNSEVGDSFRNQNKDDNFNSSEGSPGSHSSSSTKCGSVSVSAVTTEIKDELRSSNGDGSLNSGSSTEMEESSALQLLLDFPICDDMSFLEAVENYDSAGSGMGTQRSHLL